MDQNEFQLVNALASQLQHFRDRDGKQYNDLALDNLLERAQEALNKNQVSLIGSRDPGDIYFVTEGELQRLQVLVWGARMIFEYEPREFNDVVERIRSRPKQ